MIEKSKELIRYWRGRLQEIIPVLAAKLVPGQAVQKGAGLAALITTLAALAISGIDFNSGLGVPADIILVVSAALGEFAAYCLAVVVLLRLLKIIPAEWIAVIGVSVYGIVYFMDLDWEMVWQYALGIVLVEMVLGGTLAWLRTGGWGRAGRGQRALSVSLLAFSVCANAALLAWFFNPGSDAHLLDIDPARGAPQINAPDPSLPGNYPVLTLTYGSGKDLRRPEFGAQAALITRSVNAGSFVSISSDFREKARRWYWGFDEHDFPLNGRVWYPQAEGRFPLVLVVHGNHNMNDYSDTGYAYLGELLASRGYIVVSVDQNFLNGYFAGGISGENDGRAWLLLKHLEVWQDWDQHPESPFYGKVDMDKIALIGHSRGGEAVALAALFNALDYYPSNGLVPFDFGFGIRSVIAIAPTDQQYTPADHAASLTDVNYLTLAGAHDADVSTFTGLRQYNRISFSGPQGGYFKAGLYIYQANHGQFNTSWGRRDDTLPLSYVLNTKPLMPGEAQRQVAKLYISAFLDATLKDRRAYLPLFQDQRLAGDWLPPTLYMNQYEDGSYRKLATFEEDADFTTLTVPGGRLEADNLTRWREEEMEFRTGKSQENQAVILRWSNYLGSYTISLPEGLADAWELGEDDLLAFSVADKRQNGLDTLLDFSILLKDESGQQASLPLSQFMPLLPQFQSVFTRLPVWEDDKFENPGEPIFQSYRLPLAAFLQVNPSLRLDTLTEIIFSFDQVEDGEIYLDDVGFAVE